MVVEIGVDVLNSWVWVVLAFKFGALWWRFFLVGYGFCELWLTGFWG